MVPHPAEVTRVRKETHDTFTLELAADEFSFLPGQFNMLYAFGAGEAPISVSGDPQRRDRIVHTIRRVGGVTNELGKLNKGDQLGLRGPFGTGWPLEEAKGKDVLIVAGGIGLAPLRPVIYELFSRREEFDRVGILYGARTPSDLLFAKDLERWRGRFDAEVEVTVDQGDVSWRGRVGVVTSLIDRIELSPSDSVAMICGPEIMMRFTIRALERAGVSAQQTYVSMERNMKCAVGFCGHCQYGADFVCKDGPVFRFDRIEDRFVVPEL